MPLVDEDTLHGFIISELLINFIISAGDFPSPTQNLITVSAQLNVTRWRHHFLSLLVKTLATLYVKKQQSSNFTEMTPGRNVSI